MNRFIITAILAIPLLTSLLQAESEDVKLNDQIVSIAAIRVLEFDSLIQV
jgi:hypothetical protein